VRSLTAASRVAVFAACALLVAACSTGRATEAHRSSATGSTTTTAASSTSNTKGTSQAASTTVTTAGSRPTLPPPAHVVVVIEENKSAAEVLDNPDAPYIEHLSSIGATMIASYAVTHPSEPNYLALFSGSTHGLHDDSCPATGSPYTTANLASSLAGVGLRFTTYAEDLPATGSLVCSAGAYARKHNPVTDFAGLPGAANQPFTSFPASYDHLPAVSFVVPNLDHDMHDGTIAQGDAWLRSNLDGYVRWAGAHDSLLVLTWDEDDDSSSNHILTVFVGAGVRPGRFDEPIDHYSVLATLCRLYGVEPPGQAAQSRPITDIWSR
jgi:acid phosphatase